MQTMRPLSCAVHAVCAVLQASAVSADLAALTDHVRHLDDLVKTTVGHSNENANMTLALIGTVFLPLTWIAGIYGELSCEGHIR